MPMTLEELDNILSRKKDSKEFNFALEKFWRNYRDSRDFSEDSFDDEFYKKIFIKGFTSGIRYLLGGINEAD